MLAGARPSLSNVGRLAYTRAVFDEVLRLYPSIWTFSRDAVADDRLGEHHVPAGSTLMVCIYTMQRHPAHWRNSEAFDPDRFMNSGEEPRPKFAYFPFGGGPRTCLDARFALLEALVVIAMTAPRYQLDLVPGHPIVPEPMITLRPRFGMPMFVREANDQ